MMTKTMMTKTGRALMVFAALAAWVPFTALADSREQKPWQLQFDTGGLSAGYHLNRRWFIGLTQQPTLIHGASYGKRYRDKSTNEVYDQRGVEEAELTYSPRSSLEVRWSPWQPGFYFSGGVLATGADRQELTYDARARVIGDGAYSSTAMKVEVEGRSQVAPALGVGFNHVFSFGMSLGVGLLIAARQSDTPDVDVTVTQGMVSQADLAKFKKEIEDANRSPQGMLHLALGWNF